MGGWLVKLEEQTMSKSTAEHWTLYRAWMREAQDALSGDVNSMPMEDCIEYALDIWMSLECV